MHMPIDSWSQLNKSVSTGLVQLSLHVQARVSSILGMKAVHAQW
jgi:hypothetical protein